MNGKSAKEVFSVQKHSKLYLTFDDGPSAQYTGKLLDLLAYYNIKASFFSVACFAEKNPDLMQRMIDEKHLIGIHSAEHISAYLQMPGYARWDFQKSMEVMERYGIHPAYYRPPWGHTTFLTRRLARDFGLQIVLWDVMAGDWKASVTADNLADKLLHLASPGKIICLHDGRGRDHAPARTIDALAQTIPVWLKEGYFFDTIDHHPDFACGKHNGGVA